MSWTISKVKGKAISGPAGPWPCLGRDLGSRLGPDREESSSLLRREEVVVLGKSLLLSEVLVLISQVRMNAHLAGHPICPLSWEASLCGLVSGSPDLCFQVDLACGGI